MARKCDKGKGAGRDKAEKAKGHAAGVALFAGEGEARIIERCSMESPVSPKAKTRHKAGFLNKWCPDSESNQGHGDFQSPALPTELSGQRGALNRIDWEASTAFSRFMVQASIFTSKTAPGAGWLPELWLDAPQKKCHDCANFVFRFTRQLMRVAA